MIDLPQLFMSARREVNHYRDLHIFEGKILEPDKHSSSLTFKQIYGSIIHKAGIGIQVACRWSVNLRAGIGVDLDLPAIAITQDGVQIGEMGDFIKNGLYLLETRVKKDGSELIPDTNVLVEVGIPAWGAPFSFANIVSNLDAQIITFNSWLRNNGFRQQQQLCYAMVDPEPNFLRSLRGHLRVSRPRNP